MADVQIRVLWTANIVLPAAAEALGQAPTPFGGWLSLMTARLTALPGFRIGIAMRSPGVTAFRHVRVGDIDYYALPPRRRDAYDVSQADCDRVLRDFAPDILHVEGAEMRHARRFLESWDGPKLLSLQGVINGMVNYELGRLPILSMLSPANPRVALVALALLAKRQFRFMPRLEHERATMRLANYVMGV